MTCGIYILTSPSDKKYVGQSFNVERRLSSHKLKENAKNTTKFISAIKKYGFYNFTVDIITCKEELLNLTEIMYINIFDSYNNGYNGSVGGEGSRGLKQTNYAKEIASKTHKGKKLTEEQKLVVSINSSGESNGMYGRNHTTESKEKQRLASLGNLYNLGHIHSEERKDKNRKAQLVRAKYDCPYCDQLVSGKGNLKQHIKSKHK